MIGIFISYRRDDAAAWAGRLYDHLAARFGPDTVFMDIDDILPGADFRDAIDRTLERCAVLLAVVGPHWLDSVDASGQRRLDNENDYLRMEIARALGRRGRVIPVLVDGATMPTPAQLPAPLAELAFRQAFELSPTHFRRDAAALADFIAEHVGLDGPAGEAVLSPPVAAPTLDTSTTTAPVPAAAMSTPRATDTVTTEEPSAPPPRRPPAADRPAAAGSEGGGRRGALRPIGIFVLLLLIVGGGVTLYAVFGREETSTPPTTFPPEPECEIPLEFGDRCDLVRDVQLMLNEHYSDTAVDGEFGPGTRAAVREFQECRRLAIPEDELGVVDQLTWEHLAGPREECLPAEEGEPVGDEG